MLSLGLDPEKATLVCAVGRARNDRLAWLLSTVTPMGWLEKRASYKDKISRALSADTGCSPIRCFRRPTSCSTTPTWCRSARTRSSTWRSPATSPSGSTESTAAGGRVQAAQPYILESVAVVPGLDGRKMSKSYNNTIEIFDDPATIRKKVKKIVTDSTPGRGAPRTPTPASFLSLLRALGRARRNRRCGSTLPPKGASVTAK